MFTVRGFSGLRLLRGHLLMLTLQRQHNVPRGLLILSLGPLQIVRRP